MKIYVINLDQSTDRLAQQQEQFSALGISFERLPAVKASDISQDFYISNIKHGQRLLKQTEMACFLSHKKAWQMVVDINEPCAILEDDAVLTRDFAELLLELKKNNLGDSIDLINLEVQPRKKIVGDQSACALLDNEYHIYPLFLEKNGTGGYILYPNGAKKLLDKAQRKLGLADAFIFSCKNLKMAQIEPAALLQDVICPTYGVPIKAPPHSIIGAVNNSIDYHPSVIDKLIFKKNRILTQLSLGVSTIKALLKGTKREVLVDSKKFIS